MCNKRLSLTILEQFLEAILTIFPSKNSSNMVKLSSISVLISVSSFFLHGDPVVCTYYLYTQLEMLLLGVRKGKGGGANKWHLSAGDVNVATKENHLSLSIAPISLFLCSSDRPDHQTPAYRHTLNA